MLKGPGQGVSNWSGERPPTYQRPSSPQQRRGLEEARPSCPHWPGAWNVLGPGQSRWGGSGLQSQCPSPVTGEGPSFATQMSSSGQGTLGTVPLTWKEI